MNRADRAKQFQPFDALKGLQEELRSREERRTRVVKKEISEEREEQISAELAKIYKRSDVEITFYRGGHYYSWKEQCLKKTTFTSIYWWGRSEFTTRIFMNSYV